QSPHDWVDGAIDGLEQEAAGLHAEVNRLSEARKVLDKEPENPQALKRLRDIDLDLLKVETKRSSNQYWLYWYQVAKKWIYAFLPRDCFRALAWVVCAVLIGVAIKCVFEFGQESLVGSVVNLSLFDLRNRMFRNAVHLDLDQFGDNGSSE